MAQISLGALYPIGNVAGGLAVILYAKLGGAILLLAFVFGVGFRFGGMGPTAALQRDHAAMAEAATAALLAQRSQQEAETARLNKVVSDYENTPIDPVTVGISHRVFIYASRPDCPVPETRPLASGTQAPAALTLGPSGVERALGKLLEACAADARQLNAVIQLAP